MTDHLLPEAGLTFKKPDKLSLSIIRTMVGYYCFQLILFFSFAVSGDFLARYGKAFIVTSTCFHVLLFVMLLFFKNDFTIERTGQKLVRVNVANRITLLRITTLPTLLFLIIAAKEFRIRTPLLILVIIVFATDFIDGYISRKADQVTRVGRMMDSASDYTLLVVLSSVFHYYKLIPTVIFGLVLGRLGLQTVLMNLLIIIKRKIEPKTTFFGKLAVASIMVLYSVEVLKLIAGGVPVLLLQIAEIVVGVILVVSMGDKIFVFFASLAEANPKNGAIGQ